MSGPRSAPPAARLRRALALQRAGRADEAAALYRAVLRQSPDCADALHLLGVLHLDGGRPAEALPLLRRAAALAEQVAVFHNSLGLALSALGEHREALAAYLLAAALRPGSAELWANAGRTCLALDAPAEALAAFRRALELRPDAVEVRLRAAELCGRAEAWDEAVEHARAAHRLAPGEAALPLAGVLCGAGRAREASHPAGAEALYREAVAAAPECVDARFVLASLVRGAAELEAARCAFEPRVRAEPGRYPLRMRLGLVLSWMGRWGESREHFRAAVRAAPESAEAWYNLALARQGCGDLEGAAEDYRRALRLEPGSRAAHNNLANVLKELALRTPVPDHALLDQAEAEYRAGVRVDPGSAEVHHNLALLVLLRGRLREGFAEYEWRDRTEGYSRPEFVQPVWQGEPLPQGKLLVHAEQGLGDALQFCRYLHVARARCRRVALACHRPLVRLLAASFPDVDVVGAPGPVPLFDRHVPLMSLPRIAGTEVETIPGEVPYLAVNPHLRDAWRRRLESLPGVRVGVAWRGNPEHRRDGFRSVPPAEVLPLLSVPGATFVSLQKGAARPGEEALLDAGLVDRTAELLDFQDTAALVANLDLVIACDTAVLHLAGALGIPAWAMLAASPDWRWLLERDDSPWYPTLRLFRQHAPGNWAGVVARMRETLADLAARGADPSASG